MNYIKSDDTLTIEKGVRPPQEEIKIDKGIPAPRRGRPRIYPLDKMEVGDSFFVKGKRPTGLHDYALANGMRVTLRREGLGYRCWRVE